MAAGKLPAPGTDLGPCKKKCRHKDCAETRRMAEATCPFCDETIGYDRRFYDDRARGLCHADCLEDDVAMLQEVQGFLGELRDLMKPHLTRSR